MCILIQMCAHGFVCPRMQRPKVNFRSLLWLLSTSISKTRSLTEFGAYRLCSAGWWMGFWDLPALTQCWGSRCKLPGFLLDISCLSSVSSTHSPTESPAATQKFVLYHAPLTHALNSTTRNQNKQVNHNKNLSYFFFKKKVTIGGTKYYCSECTTKSFLRTLYWIQRSVSQLSSKYELIPTAGQMDKEQRVTNFGTLSPKCLLSIQEAMHVGRQKVCKS